MSSLCVREIHACTGEDEVARRWWALAPGTMLPLSDGSSYQLLFAGRRGGPQGPDVLDAVLRAVDGTRVAGAVEFHVRASDWVAHGHDRDARYNNVILHVVIVCDDAAPTRRQDGYIVPLCSLHDLLAPVRPCALETEETAWPCVHVLRRLSDGECSELLLQAGLWRFEQKAHAFVEQLHALDPVPVRGPWDSYDLCLLPALAEGLGYGRDRAFFRAAGLRLAGLVTAVPEPLGRMPQPAPLDARRLRALRRLVMEWHTPGIWRTLRAMILPAPPEFGAASALALQALRSAFRRQGLSLARSDILVCNVALPFAAAVALLEGDDTLGQRAQALYELHPGLPSNRVTRMMAAQLQLSEEPRGSCRQQGLHYIYQQTCREKRCELCIVGKREI